MPSEGLCPSKKVEMGEKLRGGAIQLARVDQEIEEAAWRLLRRHRLLPS